MLKSPAWRALSCVARCAYLEVASGFNGTNNGSIRMSVRELAALLGTAKDTANKALRELEDAGFIDATVVGSYTRKDRRASEYKINTHRCDLTGQPASKKFMYWQGVPRSDKRDRTVRKEEEDTLSVM
jgi:DNA-binding transcriptional MocR family regulator